MSTAPNLYIFEEKLGKAEAVQGSGIGGGG